MISSGAIKIISADISGQKKETNGEAYADFSVSWRVAVNVTLVLVAHFKFDSDTHCPVVQIT
jgi:hypothetical protein